MPDLTTTFRVLVVGSGKRAEDWAAAVESHGWVAELAVDGSVRDGARALLPHAAVIDVTDVEAAARAGLAVRSAGTYNAVLLFVTADERARRGLRARVPAPTFVTDKECMGALWQLPEARLYQR